MANPNAQSISVLLEKHSLNDHDEILRACNAKLKKSISNVEAQHVKAVALLKLDRYEEALDVFESSDGKIKEASPLEYAYSLYKSGKPREAAEVAVEVKDGRGARHVEAQALYRAENFSAAVKIYNDLSESNPAAERNDLHINRGAVEAQLIWSSQGALAKSQKPGREDLEAFETAYNAACGSIARGELRQAEILLKRAKELCKHSDELADEEKATELLPINVQQLYVFNRLGKFEEANTIASEVKVEEISDIATRQVAQHNLLVESRQQSNPYITHKLLDTLPKFSYSDKPFQFQQFILDANRRTVDLQARKFDGVARSTAKLLKAQQMPQTSATLALAGVLNAAAHAKGEDDKAALKALVQEMQRNPLNIGLLLTIIQIYVSIHNHASAVNLLESFLKVLEQSSAENQNHVRFSPGLVAVAVTLYKLQGRRNYATQELERAASYWKQTPNPPVLLLQAAGAALLESSKLEDLDVSAQIFSKLHKMNSDDKITAAGYVAAYAGKDPSKVRAEVEQLTPVSQLIRDIDVDSLENAGIPQSSNALANAQKTATRKRGAQDQGSNKAKRIRKSRLPKDYDPSKIPDPERWLPLRDRSTYRPKGKKGKKREADRTQGGIVADDLGDKDAGPSARPVVGSLVGGAKKNKRRAKR